MGSRVDLVKNKVVGELKKKKWKKVGLKKMKTFFIRVSDTYFLLGDSGDFVLGSLVLRFSCLSTLRAFLFIIIIIITPTLSTSIMFQISTRS